MNTELKTGGPKPREMLYAEAASHAQRAIEILVDIMENGDSDSNRVGAAKTILAKAIPDLKAMELTGQLDANVLFSQMSDEQLDKFINSKIGEGATSGIVDGEGQKTQGEPA